MKCICGKDIHKKSKRCKSCSNRNRKGKYKWNKESINNRKCEGNPIWKGDKVGYRALHRWVERNKNKSDFCEKCKIYHPLDLANISGKYKRDINDFEWLCRKCHMSEDGRLNKLNGGDSN